MRKKNLFLTLLISFFIILTPIFLFSVSAEDVNVTFVDPLGVNKIVVYYYNGTYLTDITSQSTVELNASIDYIFHIQPNATDIMRNPEVAFDWLMNLLPFIFGMFIIFAFVVMAIVIIKKGLKL